MAVNTHEPPNISLDHPGWLGDTRTHVRRAFRVDGAIQIARWSSGEVTFEDIDERGDMIIAPPVHRFDPASLPSYFRAAAPFRDNTCIQRVRNPDLWDAFLPPLFRQRRGTGDAQSLYRQFCAEYGDAINTKSGQALLPPTPDVVSELPDVAFSKLRIPDKKQSLRAAAETYLNLASDWDHLSPAQLFTELRTVPYVNTWTAGAIVADVTNDYSFYRMPVDVTYRQWTKYLADPTSDLPQQEFAQLWETLSCAHQSTVKLLLLAARHRHLVTDQERTCHEPDTVAL